MKQALDFKLLDKLAQEGWTENTTWISSANTERIFCMVSKSHKADAAPIYDTAGSNTATIKSFTCSGIIYLLPTFSVASISWTGISVLQASSTFCIRFGLTGIICRAAAWTVWSPWGVLGLVRHHQCLQADSSIYLQPTSPHLPEAHGVKILGCHPPPPPTFTLDCWSPRFLVPMSLLGLIPEPQVW